MQNENDLGADAAAVESAGSIDTPSASHVAHNGVSLLERAKQLRRSRTRTSELDGFSELAVAWLANEVTTAQVASALGVDTRQSYTNRVVYQLARQLQMAYRQGLIIKAEGRD